MIASPSLSVDAVGLVGLSSRGGLSKCCCVSALIWISFDMRFKPFWHVWDLLDVADQFGKVRQLNAQPTTALKLTWT